MTYRVGHFENFLIIIKGRRVFILLFVAVDAHELNGRYVLGTSLWKNSLARELAVVEQLGRQL